MRIFIIGFLLLCTIASAQDTGNHPWLEQQAPDMQELVKAYGADEAFLSAQDRMLEAEKRIEEARDRDRRTKTIFLVLSALVALYPAGKAVSMVRRGQLKAASRPSSGHIRWTTRITPFTTPWQHPGNTSALPCPIISSRP